VEHLTRTPISVSAEWRSTAVTTDPPRLTEHLEWEAAFTLRALAPIRVAAILEHGGELHWGLQPGEPAQERELCATFSPWRWRTSEAVQISFAGRHIRITDAALKQDARDVATVTAHERVQTLEVVSVLSLPGHAIALAFIAFALDDTEARPLGRWRVAPEVAARLPERFAPLASGYQSGTLIAGSP